MQPGPHARLPTRALVCLAFLAVSCANTTETPPPIPQAVHPDQAPQGAVTEVTIHGSGFHPEVRISYIDNSRSLLRSDFIARLGEVDLLDVRLVDSETLTAVVPATLGPGAHDLRVIDPQGRTGSLAAAFTVLDCLTDDDCTSDCHVSAVCSAGECVPEATDCQYCSDNEPCDDGDSCTQTDTCQAGVCTGGNPVVCTATDQCHDPGVCDPDSGLCSDPISPDGSGCDDNDLCTQTDTCQAGVCSGANPVVCTPSDQCHDPGTCDALTGLCSDPISPDGSGCDDNDLCTQTDTCQAGVCSGANPVVCTPSDQCHDPGVCDSLSGLCSDPLRPDGSGCDDNDLCTQTDTCQAGACSGANPVVCTASDQCHDPGICDSLTGLCSDPPRSDGSGCDDNDLCTQTDTCQGGVCSGASPVACTASDQCHDPGTCDALTGLCSDPTSPDGSGCDDNDLCTQTDTCQGGACSGANPVVCTASDQCHDPGVCDSLSGLCSDPPKPVVCGDSIPCGSEICDDGTNDGSLGSCGQDCMADPPAALEFLVQPSDAVAAAVIAPTVSVVIVDTGARRVRGSTEPISLDFDTDPTLGFATLTGQGPQAAVDGAATFPAASIDTVAQGYSLRADSPSLSSSVSTFFEIVSPDPWAPAFDAWQYRKKIVIPSRLPLTQISDFPVLISHVDADLRDRALASGFDLSFATAAGTPLEHELELYLSGDGTLVAWVKLPILDTAIDTVIYMYYGQPAATVDPSVTTVWSNGFQAVWHLKEAGSGVADEFVDSSGNNIHATGGEGSAAATPAQILAKIGRGQDLDGLDDFIGTVPSLLNGNTALSLTLWVNIRSNDNTTRPGIAGQDNVMEMGFFWLDRINLWTPDIVDLCPGKIIESLCTDEFSLGSWLFLAVSWDGTEIAMYIDGVEKHRVPLANWATSARPFNIGGGGIFDGSGNSLDGLVDEVRLATTDRPGEWYAIEYANQADPDLFYIQGFEEPHP